MIYKLINLFYFELIFLIFRLRVVRRRKFNARGRGPPDSSVSSLIQVGWCEEGHPATKNSLQHSQG